MARRRGVRRALLAAAGAAVGEKIIYFENRYRHKDGTHRWLLWAATPHVDQQTIYATARDRLWVLLPTGAARS